MNDIHNFKGNTNTATDVEIKDISQIMRPNLKKGTEFMMLKNSFQKANFRAASLTPNKQQQQQNCSFLLVITKTHEKIHTV